MGISKAQLEQLRKIIKRRDHPRRVLRSSVHYHKQPTPVYFKSPPPPPPPKPMTALEFDLAVDLVKLHGYSFKQAKACILARRRPKQ